MQKFKDAIAAQTNYSILVSKTLPVSIRTSQLFQERYEDAHQLFKHQKNLGISRQESICYVTLWNISNGPNSHIQLTSTLKKPKHKTSHPCIFLNFSSLEDRGPYLEPDPQMDWCSGTCILVVQIVISNKGH